MGATHSATTQPSTAEEKVDDSVVPDGGYSYSVVGGPSAASLVVTLAPGNELKVWPGSMQHQRYVASQDETAAQAGMTMSGGGGAVSNMLRGIGRVFAGAPLFFNTYAGPQTLSLAGVYPGDVTYIKVARGQQLVMMHDVFLACSPNVTVSVKVNAKAIFTLGIGQDDSFVLPTASVTEGSAKDGHVWLAAYGAVTRHDLSDDEVLVIDNGFLLATTSLEYQVVPLGKTILSTIFGGDHFGLKFRGPCSVYTQSRSAANLIEWIVSKVPNMTSGVSVAVAPTTVWHDDSESQQAPESQDGSSDSQQEVESSQDE